MCWEWGRGLQAGDAAQVRLEETRTIQKGLWVSKQMTDTVLNLLRILTFLCLRTFSVYINTVVWETEERTPDGYKFYQLGNGIGFQNREAAIWGPINKRHSVEFRGPCHSLPSLCTLSIDLVLSPPVSAQSQVCCLFPIPLLARESLTDFHLIVGKFFFQPHVLIRIILIPICSLGENIFWTQLTKTNEDFRKKLIGCIQPVTFMICASRIIGLAQKHELMERFWRAAWLNSS